MIFKVKNYNSEYRLDIRYHFKSLAGIKEQIFPTYDLFEEFMKECHPDIKNYNEVGIKFYKRVEFLSKLANEGTYNSWYEDNSIHCFISGDSLIITESDAGNLEKMYEHFKTSKKVNEGYLHSFLADNWTFKNYSNIVGIQYYDDPEKNDKFKIHCFKDKVVFEGVDGNIHSMIVSDKYWIHYDGKKKDSK
jgi:hypothetical protein